MHIESYLMCRNTASFIRVGGIMLYNVQGLTEEKIYLNPNSKKLYGFYTMKFIHIW